MGSSSAKITGFHWDKWNMMDATSTKESMLEAAQNNQYPLVN
jgi:hypothetical protein